MVILGNMGYIITTSNIKYSANNANESNYSIEDITPDGYGVNETEDPWILAEGFWNDDGRWVDGAEWNDG